MRYFLSLLLCVLLFAGASAFGQSTFGTFVGTVQDQSGSVIAGAIVSITNLDENAVRSASTNSSGQYQLLNVPAGRYSISVIKAGFAPAKVNEVTLDARQERRVDLSLALASVQQTVEVSASAATINTENATIANTMTSQAVMELPANYRGASTSPLGRYRRPTQCTAGPKWGDRPCRLSTIPSRLLGRRCLQRQHPFQFTCQQHVPFGGDARGV